MGQIFAPPKEVGPAPQITHPFDYKAYEKECADYIQKVVKFCQVKGSSECAGKEIYFPVADGNARYIVFSLKPIKLIHLPIGDAWQFQYANRLTAADIRDQVRRHETLEKLFASK